MAHFEQPKLARLCIISLALGLGWSSCQLAEAIEPTGMGTFGLTYGTLTYEDDGLDYLFKQPNPVGLSIYGFSFEQPAFFHLSGEMNSDDTDFNLGSFERSIGRISGGLSLTLNNRLFLFGGGGVSYATGKLTDNTEYYSTTSENSGIGYNLIGGGVFAVLPVAIEVRILSERAKVGNLEVGGGGVTVGVHYATAVP